MLSNKIRITVRPQKLARYSEKHARFYRKYAIAVFRTLRKPLFQNFLNWMMKRENIEEHMVTNVQVMAFPFRKKNGKGLAGKRNLKGEIFIYPKRLDFCRKLIRNCGKEKVYSYIKNRARATLIHELLHVKHLGDEGKVRELTRKYFYNFVRHQNTENSKSLHNYENVAHAVKTFYFAF